MTLLEKTLINRVRQLRNSTCRRGKPLVLRGREGEIIYELLKMIVDGYECKFIGCGLMFIDSSPIYTEHELSTQSNTYHGYIS